MCTILKVVTTEKRFYSVLQPVQTSNSQWPVARRGWHPNYQVNSSASVFPLLAIFFIASLIAIKWILWTLRKTKMVKLRVNLFDQNGGNLLMKKLKKSSLKIFTAEEIKVATNNYSSSRVIMHRCTPGTFYHGSLADGDKTEVVIMKIQRVAKSQIKQFVDQLIFLSKPHGNLLRIIGCCLETSSPLIVYELHTNDGNFTLSDHVHDLERASRFSFDNRVKAAAGAARALAHFHSKNSRGKFVHGNVASANVLLDDSYDAKLFYAAGFSPFPPYTTSNDVYSFGLVLAELLTGDNRFASDMQGNDGNMALDFVSKVNEGCLSEILDDRLVAEEDACLVQMKEVAVLAERCLAVESGRRPKMKEVAAKLRTLIQQG